MVVKRRHLRLAGMLILGWIIAESVIFYAATQSIGVLPTLAFLMFKGVGGLMLLVRSLRSIFRGMALNSLRKGLSGAGTALFSAAGAILILIPGFIATLLGLALFSPSARMAILHWIKGGKSKSGDKILTLDPGEWREVSKKRKRKPRSLPP